jgi:hypothetical protein
MKQIIIAFRKIRTLEKIFLILTFAAVVFKHIFNLKETVDIFVFGVVLAILYFPLGFYYLGKPSNNSNIIFSILSGFIYASGVVSLIMGTLKIEGYEYPLIIILFFLLIISFFLLFKLRAGSYSKEYVYAHFIRIVYIIIVNLIVLLF